MNLLAAVAFSQASEAFVGGRVAMAADVAIILIGLFALVGSVLGIYLLLQLRKVGRGLDRVTRQLRGSADPILEHGKGIAANVEFITATVRTDVEKLNTSVRALSDRLVQASDRMEERIEEFNALMEVVQGEAEDVFLDTAATVRGVKAGASSLASGDRPRSTVPVPVEPDADDPNDDFEPPAVADGVAIGSEPSRGD